MKKILILFFILSIIWAGPAYGHKLIVHDDSHMDFDSALKIPDHRISWVIYENLGVNEAKFYSFDARYKESFYASIVIPKMTGLEDYSPTLVLMGPKTFQDKAMSVETQMNADKFQYDGEFPGREFYEPFSQVTYWERQEVSTVIPADGQYFIVVMDEKKQSGKYSLAIGTVEDFSAADFFLILPKAWFDTKIFFNDYSSIVILFSVLISIPTIVILTVLRTRRKKSNVSTVN